MKLCIIFPPLPFGWTPVAPPILEYLAALTRRFDPSIEIKLISVSAMPNAFDTLECDLAAISILTPTSVPGYRIADKLRARGITVVFGGMHASAMPEEAKQYGDAVVRRGGIGLAPDAARFPDRPVEAVLPGRADTAYRPPHPALRDAEGVGALTATPSARSSHFSAAVLRETA